MRVRTNEGCCEVYALPPVGPSVGVGVCTLVGLTVDFAGEGDGGTVGVMLGVLDGTTLGNPDGALVGTRPCPTGLAVAL